MGRVVHRREPDEVDTEIFQVVEAHDDRAQVADAVAIAVLERAGVNLVAGRSVPPTRRERHCGGRLCAGGERGVSLGGAKLRGENPQENKNERWHRLSLCSENEVTFRF